MDSSSMELSPSSKKILDSCFVISNAAGLSFYLHRTTTKLERVDFDFKVLCGKDGVGVYIYVWHPDTYKDAVKYLEKKFQRPPVVANFDECCFPFRHQSRL